MPASGRSTGPPGPGRPVPRTPPRPSRRRRCAGGRASPGRARGGAPRRRTDGRHDSAPAAVTAASSIRARSGTSVPGVGRRPRSRRAARGAARRRTRPPVAGRHWCMLSRVPRAADLPVRIGLYPSGPTARSSTCRAWVLGHATVWRDEPPPPRGRGVARTGVTVLDPGGNCSATRCPRAARSSTAPASAPASCRCRSGAWWRRRCSSPRRCRSAGCYDAACELLCAEEPGDRRRGRGHPLVAECDDSFLSDARRMQVDADDVREALSAARASVGHGASPPDEGAVGAGTGMTLPRLEGRHRLVVAAGAVRATPSVCSC